MSNSVETNQTPLEAGYADTNLRLALSSVSWEFLSKKTARERQQIDEALVDMLFHFCRALNRVAQLDPKEAKEAAINAISAVNDATSGYG